MRHEPPDFLTLGDDHPIGSGTESTSLTVMGMVSVFASRAVPQTLIVLPAMKGDMNGPSR